MLIIGLTEPHTLVLAETMTLYSMPCHMIDIDFVSSMSSKATNRIVKPTSNYFGSSHYLPY